MAGKVTSLKMHKTCKGCGTALPAGSRSAHICSYERTFCTKCTNALKGRCPKCAGELVRRPRRKKAA